MQTNYSSNTGLVPDFYYKYKCKSDPAGANYLEGIHDGDYYSNTIKLLFMLIISKNYWVPDCDDLGVSKFNLIEEQHNYKK